MKKIAGRDSSKDQPIQTKALAQFLYLVGNRFGIGCVDLPHLHRYRTAIRIREQAENNL
jgi:hypothetical protein